MELREGYKQTEVGVIPEDWEVKKFVEVTHAITCGVAATPRYVNEVEGKPFLSASNVQNGKVIGEPIRYIPVALYNQITKHNKPEKGDILYTRVGAGIGEAGVVEVDFDFAIYVSLTLIKPKRAINCYFLKSLLNSDYYKFLAKRDQFAGGGVQNLNVQVVREFLIPIPKYNEQTAIANTLSDADALISSLEKLITKKRSIKQGTIQKLLKPKEEWVMKKMSQLGKPYGGLSGKAKADFGNGNSLYIPFMNIMKNPVIDKDFMGHVRIGNSEVQNRVIKGDLFFNGSSETPEEVGMCSIIVDNIPNLYLNSFCFGFRLHDDLEVDGLYLSYFFRSEFGRKVFFSLAQGATRYNLSKLNFMKVVIKLPAFEEQNRIATILSDMDAEISALEAKLAKYKQIKQGMMQNLLTGKIRLIKKEELHALPA